MSGTMATVPSIVGFACFFLGIWFGITVLMSLFGGWFKLSKIFRDSNPPRNQQFTFESIYMGSVNYKGCISGCLGADGLHLKILLLYPLMHPPLFIPWSEITSITVKNWIFFTSNEVVIRQTGTKIGFYGELGEAILKEWQERSHESLPARYARPGHPESA
jgi:hypothetical protein